MPVHPILSAMRHNKVGAALIGLQIAVTLAILCNALFIIQQRLAQLGRPSGTDEANLFAIANDWIGTGDHRPGVINDVAALRAMPGVAGAYVTNTYPLSNRGGGSALWIQPPVDGTRLPAADTAVYYGGEQMLQTLGLRLIDGRNFSATDIVNSTDDSQPVPDGLIITQALALKLFPDGPAVGRGIYIMGWTRTVPVIGVVGRLQGPFVSGGGDLGGANVDNSVLMPYRDVGDEAYYVVRARPGQLAAVMKAAPQRLLQLDPERLIEKLQSFSAARAAVYHDDRGLALILAIVCAVLLVVMACGIVGLTSYWVSQRRRQIGIRRALGATRPGIVRHFQTENLLIVAAGSIVGVAMGLAANLWMMSSSALARLPIVYPIVGVIALLILGQLAVLWPALRAASVPPAEASRTV
ncbi:MAG TPA: FtsX-like permease family protein [Steroidobacteraceae bacterium]|jgi:putative ABC transport system permease protein|nr:FtsX-like permease family protein [Steroidobacteraceae bacterium]